MSSRASYRILLFNSKGKPSNARYAVSYEIWYGSKKVLKRSPLPKYAQKSFSKETTQRKKAFLERTVFSIEKKRLEIIKERALQKELQEYFKEAFLSILEQEYEEERAQLLRAKEELKALKEKAEAEKREAKEKLKALKEKRKEKKPSKEIEKIEEIEELPPTEKPSRRERMELTPEVQAEKEKVLNRLEYPVKETIDAYARQDMIDFANLPINHELKLKIDKSIDEIVASEKIRWSEGREEEPLVLPSATVQDVLIFPIKPKLEGYKKQLIQKKIVHQAIGSYHLDILDFTLDTPILLNSETFIANVDTIKEAFLAHMLEFYDAVKNIRKSYILRIKFAFMNFVDGEEIPTNQGISMTRFYAQNFSEIAEKLMAAYFKLKGSSTNRGQILTKNYLLGGLDLFITGFTLEAGEI